MVAPTMAFVPFHARVTAPDAVPSRWMLVLHGILGSGGNFRSIARRLATAHPDWGFVLVDLREHGQSLGAPPPHTIAAAAADLTRIEVPVAGVIGHSFGGKVALAYAAARAGDPLDQAWVLDASPGTRRDRSGLTERVLRMLRAMPQPLPSRERFLEIVRAEGHSAAIAEWLAMNVRREADGMRFRLDLDAIAALLDDYFAVDLWPVVERAEGAREMHVVVADRSDALDAKDRARLQGAGAREPRLHPHLVLNAGHWVHVDAPEAVFSLISGALSP